LFVEIPSSVSPLLEEESIKSVPTLQLRMEHAPEMVAVLNNIVLGLLARIGEAMWLTLDATSPISSRKS
jgi:hypothetical protein